MLAFDYIPVISKKKVATHIAFQFKLMAFVKFMKEKVSFLFFYHARRRHEVMTYSLYAL